MEYGITVKSYHVFYLQTLQRRWEEKKNEKKKILEMYEYHFEKYSNKNEDRNGEEAIKM